MPRKVNTATNCNCSTVVSCCGSFLTTKQDKTPLSKRQTLVQDNTQPIQNSSTQNAVPQEQPEARDDRQRPQVDRLRPQVDRLRPQVDRLRPQVDQPVAQE